MLHLQRKIDQKIARACKEYSLIQADDRILVCMSGGKDSYTLLDALQRLQDKVPFAFALVAYHLNQKQPGYPDGRLQAYLEQQASPFEIDEFDSYTIVQERVPSHKTPCSLCSRLRRGRIYAAAERHGCNKIALGHHRDDSIETLLLNLFYAGQMQGMPALYQTDDRRFTVIRPLVFVPEPWIVDYAKECGFPIVPCNLCGSLDGKRNGIRKLLTQLEEEIPQVRDSLLAAMTNVRKSHLLDPRLQDPQLQEVPFSLMSLLVEPSLGKLPLDELLEDDALTGKDSGRPKIAIENVRVEEPTNAEE